MKKGFLLSILVSLALVGGCAQPRQERSLLCANQPRQVVFDASVEVLRDLHFDLETADPGAGLVRTWPLRGAQFFEFWRGDNASAETAALANLHSIQRTVEIEVSSGMGKTCLDSRVFVRRLSMPGEFVGGTYQMATLFSEGDYREQSLLLDPDRLEEGEINWIDLGRDGALEQELLTRIENAIQKGK